MTYGAQQDRLLDLFDELEVEVELDHDTSGIIIPFESYGAMLRVLEARCVACGRATLGAKFCSLQCASGLGGEVPHVRGVK